ncbi:MAG: hypothetical protein KGL39_45225 [Patescibacteria group bacterium]|nr:hypothetical protein [Patescibacteria group bacterium]
MQRLRTALTCALLASLIGLVVCIGFAVHRATAALCALPAGVQAEVQATRTALVGEIQATRGDLNAQIDGVRKDLLGKDGQVASLRDDVMSQVAELRDTADRRLGDTLARVDTALVTVDQLRADLQPTLTNVQAITGHANEASAILFRRDALPAQLLGAVAAAKTTLGQTTLTMRTFQQAEPALLEAAQKVANNSDAATAKTVAAAEESRRLLHNLAENTTPLPKWIRYPAQVVGLVGSAAVPVVTLQKLESVK